MTAEGTAQADAGTTDGDTQDPGTAQADDRLGDNGLKALQAERAAKKAALADARKAREEAEKAAAALQETEERLKALEAERERATALARVASETGVPADVIRGSTEEEMRAHADALKPLLNRGPVVPSAGRQPDTTATDPRRQFLRDLVG